MPRTRPLLAALLLPLTLSSSGCSIAMPFRGPGYDRERGVTVPTPSGSVVVALTEATLDRAKRRPFDRATGTVADGMNAVPGLIGYSFRKRLFGDRAWTMTVWTDRDALRRFVDSDLHTDAMDAGYPASIGFRFHALDVPADEIPLSWSRALDLLERDGSDDADLGR